MSFPASPSVDDLLDQLVAPPPPPIRASSPLPAPPPPCNDYNDAPRPKSMGADSDIRYDVSTCFSQISGTLFGNTNKTWYLIKGKIASTKQIGYVIKLCCLNRP